MKNNCCGGISLPSSNNSGMKELEQLKREIKKLLETTEARLLCQSKKIDETMVYIKNNLSNSLRDLLDSMINSGELEEIITQTITDITYLVEDVEKDTDKLYIYTPSLINSVNSESIALVMNKNCNLLFDTGRDTSAIDNVNYLRSKLGNKKLNAVFISHYHTDHVGGLESILPLLDNAARVYLPMNFISYYNGSDDSQVIIDIRNQVISLLESNNICYEEVCTDKVLTYGEVKVKLTNSTPQAYTYYNNHQSRYNAYSMNATVCIGENKALFPGDSLIDTQDYLLSVEQVEKVSVFATNHHGFERRSNTEYLEIINPDYEFFSVSPLSWDDVVMTNYDYTLRNKPIQFSTEAFGSVEYVLTKNDTLMLNGFYTKENMFVNKRLDVYVDPNYVGVPDGSETRPFRTLSQAISYLPEVRANVVLHLEAGTYEEVRFLNIPYVLQVEGSAGGTTLRDLQISNCSAIYFRNVYIEGNTVANYGFAYFNLCTFDCQSIASGNIGITLNRINASFGNCRFINCYTGLYAQSGCQVVAKDCEFNCEMNAIYGINSYISLDNYELINGILREETGATIKTVARGNSSNVPNFNNSNNMRGYQYFATNLGYPLFYFNDGGVDHWRKADGTVVI